MSKGRRTPYTEIGVRRLPCFRCGHKPSVTQWQVCADGRVFRPMCLHCDLELNALVLTWAKDPDVRNKMETYIREMREKYER